MDTWLKFKFAARHARLKRQFDSNIGVEIIHVCIIIFAALQCTSRMNAGDTIHAGFFFLLYGFAGENNESSSARRVMKRSSLPEETEKIV